MDRYWQGDIRYHNDDYWLGSFMFGNGVVTTSDGIGVNRCGQETSRYCRQLNW